MKFFKRRMIKRNDQENYLDRFNIFECKYFSIKVHHILLSDDDCLHDHPWAFLTFLLSGGYGEHTEQGYAHHKRWSVLYRPARFRHSLLIDKPVWTFVITFKRERTWGFWNSKGFTPWYKYEGANGKCE